MHATIQKPIDEIMTFFQPEERVFVVGCGNCAAKAHSGGEPETKEMARRLQERGVNVAGWACTDSGVSLCKLSITQKMLNETCKEETDQADSYLILACGQGIHTVMDATDGGMVHPGYDTIFGGETVNDNLITEYCSLCGDCIVEYTGGLCPVTLCAKSLLNGPCGGARNGKCEVDRNRDCGWQLIYRLCSSVGYGPATREIKIRTGTTLQVVTCLGEPCPKRKEVRGMQELIQEFMAQRKFAVIGATDNPEKYGNQIVKNLKKRGYTVFPVNPRLLEVENLKCYSALADLPEKVDVVDFVVPPSVTEQMLEECVQLGFQRIWLQPGSESEAAITFCKDHSLKVVHDVCVMMN